MKKIFTCKTVGCLNENISIILETEATMCTCGPCGQLITDVVDTV